MKTTVSVIIPYRSDNGGRRDKILDYVVARWEALFPAYEIIVSDDDSGCLAYNKARAINNAVARAKGSILVIADADVIFDQSTIEQAVGLVKSGKAKWMIPFTICERLDEKSTVCILKGNPDDPLPVEYDVCSGPSHGPGAINILPRAAWDMIGGYDENFIGWGFEDNAFELILNELWGKAQRLPDTIHHLSHPRAVSAARNSPFRIANERRFKVYQQLAKLYNPDRLLAFKNKKPKGEPVDCLILKGRHYIDHVAPIWNALPVEKRGRFIVTQPLVEHAAKYGIKAEAITKPHITETLRQSNGLVLLAGHADSEWTDKVGRKSVIIMHGVGFNFDVDKSLPNYPGTTKNRQHVVLMLSTNEQIAEIERAGNPQIPVVVIGCPKLDTWHNRPKKRLKKGEEPVIALAWHWRCKIAPEAGTAFDYYKHELSKLAAKYKVIGHGHPNIIDEIAPIYEKLGIEVVRDLDEVFERAHVLVADATSAMYEFASLDRPVVVCNAPFYRRNVDFGLRFWKHADVGVQCNKKGDLIKAVEEALIDPPVQKKLRRAAVKYAYTYTDGKCAERAAVAIVEASERFAADTPQQPVNRMRHARGRMRHGRRHERMRRAFGG